jgi:hypothetical protein
MVVNTTFNNISVISWRSVLLVEETVVLGENHRPASSHWQTLYWIRKQIWNKSRATRTSHCPTMYQVLLFRIFRLLTYMYRLHGILLNVPSSAGICVLVQRTYLGKTTPQQQNLCGFFLKKNAGNNKVSVCRSKLVPE